MSSGVKALQKEYWQVRCELAERCLEESPCDPDITKGQIEAHRAYDNYCKNPDATALYTGFNELIEKKGMKYLFSQSNENAPYSLRFWRLDEDVNSGHHVTSTTIYGAFEIALHTLKVI